MLRTAALAAIACATAAPAGAETVDYGALEQLFGEPVTTSATGQPQRVSEAPANMEIITADEIRRSGATDIPGVLRHVGGIDVLEWSRNQTDVSVRGYNQAFTPRLLVLVDGRQVYADYYGFTPWNALPVEMAEIRQIEVVKGPNAALFGFNAVGGVINIITFDPARERVRAASVAAGSQGSWQASAIETFPIGDRGAVRLSLGAFESDEYDTPDTSNVTAVRPKRPDRDSVALDGTFELRDGLDLRVSASRTLSSRNEAIPNLQMVGSDIVSTSVRGQLDADTPLGLVTANVYTNRIDYDSEPSGIFDAFNFDNRVTVAQLEDLFTVGPSHTFHLAIEHRRNRVNTTPSDFGKIAYDVNSASAMWNWRISPKFSLTNAVRYDALELERIGPTPPGYAFTNADWDRDIDATSFNTGLVCRVGAGDTLRLTAARGVQLPNLTYFGALLLATPFFGISGAPDLDPATIDNVELAWEHDVGWSGGRLRASIFHQTTDDLSNSGGRTASAPPGPSYSIASNFGDSQTTGLEIGLDGVVDDAWRWSVDYRAQTIDDDFIVPASGVRTVNFEDTTPEHLANARLGWSGGRWEVDGFLRYQSDTAGPLTLDRTAATPLATIDAYVSFDGRVGYALSDAITISVFGQNLGQDDQRQTQAPNVERRLMGALTARF